MNEDKWPDNFTNPIESDRRGYRCIHCDVDGDSQFCHYHKKQIVSLPQHDKQMREEGAKAERERLIKEAWDKFYKAFGFPMPPGNPEELFIPTLEPSEVSDILESLRHGQKQECEPE